MSRGLSDSEIIVWYARKDLTRLEAWWHSHVPSDQWVIDEGWEPVLAGKMPECAVFNAITQCRYIISTDGIPENSWYALWGIRELIIELNIPGGDPLNVLSPGKALAMERHKDNHADRDFVREWYKINHKKFASKDAAAIHAYNLKPKLVNQTLRTIRGYLTNM
ncbi:MAG: hypothetical protein WBG92_01300 [Thiohalocapsa sp.]